MVYLVVTPPMRKLLSSTSHASQIIQGPPPVISHDVLHRSFLDFHSDKQNASHNLSSLLDETTPIVFFTLSHAHPPASISPNKALEQRLKFLREREENRLYRQMVRDVNGGKDVELEEENKNDLKLSWRAVGGWVGLDVLVTMGTGFAIGWFCGSGGKGGTWGLVGGLFGLIAGLLVEGCLVMVRMVAVDRAMNESKGDAAHRHHTTFNANIPKCRNC